jgi:hypothetical protein
MPGGVKQRRIEERRIALGEWQLDAMGVEPGGEFGLAIGEIAGRERLRERQVVRRSAFQRHIAMRDGALQPQERRELVRVGPQPKSGWLRFANKKQKAIMLIVLDNLQRKSWCVGVENVAQFSTSFIHGVGGRPVSN